jgi:hypothetical protein
MSPREGLGNSRLEPEQEKENKDGDLAFPAFAW